MQEIRCTMPGCDKAQKHKESGLCGRCYSWMYYWSNKSPTRKMKRLQQVQFWEKRMEAVWKNK